MKIVAKNWRVPFALALLGATIYSEANAAEIVVSSFQVGGYYGTYTPGDDAPGSYPATIAPAVVWLASEAAKDITGRVYEMRGDRVSIAEGWVRGPVIETDEPWTVASLGDELLRLHREARPNSGLDGLTPTAPSPDSSPRA